MEIQVRTLRDALDLLKPVVPRKPTLEVLNNVLLEDGHLRATDLDVGVEVELAVPSDGLFLLPYLKVVELLKRVQGNETLILTQDKRTLKLSWSDGQASFEIEAKPEDFPPFPTPKDTLVATVDGDALIPAMAALTVYAAQDDGRPTLQGVTLLLGEQLRLFAADGFRLAYKTLPMALQAEGIESVIIPLHAIDVLEHVGRKAPREALKVGTLAQLLTAKRNLALTMDKTTLRIQCGKVTVTTRLIQGNPPDYLSLIPIATVAEATVMAPDLERAVHSVLGTAKEASGIVRLSWSEDSMKVQSGGEDSIEMTVPIVAGTPGRIALNIKYVLDYLRDKSSVVKIVLVGTGAEPVTLTYGSAPLVVVTPMQVNWGDEPIAEVPEPEAAVEPSAEATREAESDTHEHETAAAPEATPSDSESEMETAAQPKAKKPRRKKTVTV